MLLLHGRTQLSLPRGKIATFPCWKVWNGLWPVGQVAQGQHGAPHAGFWQHLLCEMPLSHGTDVSMPAPGQCLSQPGLAALLCSVSLQLFQLSQPQLSPVAFLRLPLPIRSTQMLPPVEEAAWGGLARVTETLVPSGGAPGHLPALLPLDKPCSLPRTSLGG